MTLQRESRRTKLSDLAWLWICIVLFTIAVLGVALVLRMILVSTIR